MQLCSYPAAEIVGVLIKPWCLNTMGFAEWDLLEVGLLGDGIIYKICLVSLVEITPFSSTLLVPPSHSSDLEIISIVLE